MPVEFALRPRLRLREDPAPVRRARPRLPKFALPALAYWLVIGGLVYGYVRQHDASSPPAAAETALAQLPAPAPPAVRPWWRPLPARVEPPPPPSSDPEPPAPELEAPLAEAPLAEPPSTALALVEPPSAALPLAEPPSTITPLAETRPEPARPRSPAPRLALAPRLRPDPVDAPAPAPALSLPSAPVNGPAPVPALPSPPVAGTLPSCEAASASASQDVDFAGGNRVADLPTQAIAAVLENGAWLSSCAVPERTAIEVCVAIKGGRVVGASVSSRPSDSSLNQCVRRRASLLQFPYSPHLDLARTRF